MDRIAALLRRSVTDPRPDGELLAAFLGGHDDAAFGELVRRHGPTVWGVCRRALPNLADAEDVFQATFLVLTRRASRLTAARTVGPWLFEVATRTAANVCRRNARHRRLFAGLPDAVADPRPPAPAADLDSILLGLPGRYRAVLLMCYLEELTHREAADRLGCAEGTVSSLVSRGLARLRARFAGRVPAAVLGTAAAAAPAGLTAATARSAVALRVGLLSAVTPATTALTRGVLRMFWIKKAGAVSVIAASFLAAIVGARALTNGRGPVGPDRTAHPPAPGGGPARVRVDSDAQPVAYGLPPMLQSGTVKAVFVKDGQEITSDMLADGKRNRLYAFDDTIPRADLNRARTAVEYARTKVAEAEAGVERHTKIVEAVREWEGVAEQTVKAAAASYGTLKSKLIERYKAEKVPEADWPTRLGSDTAPFEAYLKRAAGEWDGAKAKLAQVGAVDPRIKVTEAKTLLAQAEAEEAKAKVAVDLCVVRARTAGVVEQVSIAPGTTLSAASRTPALWMIPTREARR